MCTFTTKELIVRAESGLGGAAAKNGRCVGADFAGPHGVAVKVVKAIEDYDGYQVMQDKPSGSKIWDGILSQFCR